MPVSRAAEEAFATGVALNAMLVVTYGSQAPAGGADYAAMSRKAHL